MPALWSKYAMGIQLGVGVWFHHNNLKNAATKIKNYFSISYETINMFL
jgi:hypothetical protein